MKKEPKKKYSSTELYHAWANKLIKEPTKGGVFSADETNLFYNNNLVAKYHTFHNTKNYVFIKEFSNIGSYGNGYSNHCFINAFDNHKITVIVCKEIPSDFDNISLEFFRSYFFKAINDELNKVAYYKEIMSNKRLTSITNWWLLYFNNLYEVHKTLRNLDNVKYQEFLNIEYVFNACTTIYSRWERSSGSSFRKELKFKPKDLLRKREKLFIDQETIDEINFRDWRYNNTKINSTVYDSSRNRYGRRETQTSCFLYSYEKSKEIYIDPEKRAKVTEEVKRRNKEFYKRKEEKRKKDNEKKALANYNNIKVFRIGTDSHNRFDFLYPILRLMIDKDRVQTSLGVIITVKEAKKAFKFFKYHIDNGIMFVDASTPAYNHTTVKGFKIISVQKEPYDAYNKGETVQIVKKTDWVMTIGCHKIPYEEVIEFLNYYKLNWNNENKNINTSEDVSKDGEGS
jgi:hypothetical protein